MAGPRCGSTAALALVLVAVAAAPAQALPPVIVVPGFSSSNLSITLQNAPTAVSWCNTTTTTPHSLWPVDPAYGGLSYPCWLEDITTFFDNVTRTFSSKAGANVTTEDFGFFGGDSLGSIVVPEFTALGWTVGKDLFDAPYDWRFSSAGLFSYYANLQALIERAYNTNDKQKVALLAISYGPQIALGFLHRMTQTWKDTYLRLFLAISPVWSGTPSALEGVVAGFEVHNPYNVTTFALKLLWNVAVRTHSSTWLFPRAGSTNVTWGKGSDDWLVQTPSKTYSAFDMEELFVDLGYNDLVPGLRFLQTEPDLTSFDPPGVDTFVTYGYAVPTPGQFVFSSDFHDSGATKHTWPGRVAKVVYPAEGGDGIVPLRSSLRAEAEWPGNLNGKNLYYKGYFNQTHGVCAISPSSGGPDDHCYVDVITALKTNVFPADAHHYH